MGMPMAMHSPASNAQASGLTPVLGANASVEQIDSVEQRIPHPEAQHAKAV